MLKEELYREVLTDAFNNGLANGIKYQWKAASP
jgi:hypothetical protein